MLDGRDIGTVICPDADVKIFVTAAPEVRAGRRAAEYRAAGRDTDDATVLADIDGAQRLLQSLPGEMEETITIILSKNCLGAWFLLNTVENRLLP